MIGVKVNCQYNDTKEKCKSDWMISHGDVLWLPEKTGFINSHIISSNFAQCEKTAPNITHIKADMVENA
jgi:hypothetical protein